MKAYLIVPIQKLFFNDRVFDLKKVDGNVFGGFCHCGGEMYQKAWVEDWMMISECERCWRVEGFLFENKRFVERFEIEVVEDVKDFLSEVLTPAELEAIVNKAKNANYNYNAFSRAKKRLEVMNLNVEDVIKALR